MAAQKHPAQPISIAIYRPEDVPQPPDHLGEPGAALWRAIQAEFLIDDAAGLALLLDCCSSRDTAERLRKAIRIEGDTVELANGGTKVNGLLQLELSARNLTSRLLGKLGVLDDEPKRGPGRPPKRGGW